MLLPQVEIEMKFSHLQGEMGCGMAQQFRGGSCFVLFCETFNGAVNHMVWHAGGSAVEGDERETSGGLA